MALPGRHEAGVGCLVIVAAGLLTFMALQVGAIRGMGPHVEVDVLLDDAAGLSTGAVVSIAGVSIGRVEALTVDFDKARARLTLEAGANVRADAIVVMRSRSILGEKYLEIVPSSHDAPVLVTGDTLAVSRGQVEIDQLVTRLAPLVEAIDPEALRQVGASLSLSLQEDPDRPARMLADAERALLNVADASDQLPATVGEARATLAEARATLSETRATLASVRRTSEEARPVIARLSGTAERLDTLIAAVPPEELPALLDELRATVKEGRAILTKLDGSTANLEEVLAKVNRITTENLSHWAREEGVLIRLVPRRAEPEKPAR